LNRFGGRHSGGSFLGGSRLAVFYFRYYRLGSCGNTKSLLAWIQEFLPHYVARIKPGSNRGRSSLRTLVHRENGLAGRPDAFRGHGKCQRQLLLLSFIHDLNNVPVARRIEQPHHISSGRQHYAWHFQGLRNRYHGLAVVLISINRGTKDRQAEDGHGSDLESLFQGETFHDLFSFAGRCPPQVNAVSLP